MTSAEPSRTAPYSPDIGWRVVWQGLAGHGMGMNFQAIAAHHLQIVVGTAHHLLGCCSHKQPERPLSRKVDDLLELFIIGLIHENLAMYLSEI